MKENDINFNFDNSYLKLSDLFYTIQYPSKVTKPKLVMFNDSLAKEIGLNSEALKSYSGVEILAGNSIYEGSTPISQAYAGHQFGHFTMLGDGRAILLGEHIINDKRLDIQLKGAGRTPYSRGGDGKAALGPMLREYIISEAMYGLKIPTTRSLAVVETGESIIREKIEPGAVLTRIASSHIRVGTFQYAARFTSYKDLKALADYTLERHYKEGLEKENPYLYLLKEVIKKQASLVSKWIQVGFIHGVMNTDNVTISGETIDYGPCAFMDTYNPNTVFSSIDYQGRYAYANQRYIIAWNLARFAETLIPLLSDSEKEAINLAQKEISKFDEIYKGNYILGMRKKLGLFTNIEEDENLINDLLNLMNKYEADYTNTFRNLTLGKKDDIIMFETEEFKKWNNRWKERLSKENKSEEEIVKLMKSMNPSIIPRNHRVEEAIEAAVKNNDYTVINNLLNALSDPFDYIEDKEEYTKLPKPTNIPYRTFCGT
ncbi:YdiU family protein [Clostridium sp. Sa3CUN1]|uniref:Protein nucleotidyltransferase YdiU n=1 Tax=Clostridium gallinarum TaxID=2762246 RepID=A0ABR8Q5P2_9CLOT|nr:YdiU family protein [Clostridium gallinarum]MBD7915753.1 YdiU family protein [Clostridium gallinarum]